MLQLLKRLLDVSKLLADGLVLLLQGAHVGAERAVLFFRPLCILHLPEHVDHISRNCVSRLFFGARYVEV